MKHAFVVDENIILCGARGVDEYDKPDSSSRGFLAYLLRNCHMMLADGPLKAKYQEKFEILRRDCTHQLIDHRILRLIKMILYQQDKLIKIYDEIPNVVDLTSVPREDREIAYLVYHVKKILVTLDNEFRDSINTHKEFIAFGLKALHPKDAIPLVKHTDKTG